MKFFKPVYTSVDLKDATITVGSVTATIGEGNLTFTEKRNIEYLKDRGNLDDVKEGDQEPVDVSFNATWKYLQSSSASGGNLEAAIKGTNGDSSSDEDACRPFACDITVVLDPACGVPMTIVLADFRWESLQHDLRGATIDCSGKCNIVSPTITYGT